MEPELDDYRYDDESFEAITPTDGNNYETDAFCAESPADQKQQQHQQQQNKQQQQQQEQQHQSSSSSSSSSPNSKSVQPVRPDIRTITTSSLYDYDNDDFDFDADEEKDDFDEAPATGAKQDAAAKFKCKKSKIKKPKAKKVKATPIQQPCAAPPPRSEAENERLVDDLLDQYDLYPKTLRSKPSVKERAPPPRATASTNDHRCHGHVPPPIPPQLRGDGGEQATASAARKEQQCQQQAKRLQATRSSVDPILRAAVKSKSKSKAEANAEGEKEDAVGGWSASEPSALRRRVSVLEEREKALIEAVEELSGQNEELIKKLKLAMSNELQLELRLLSLCSKKREQDLPSAKSGSVPQYTEDDEDNGDEEDAESWHATVTRSTAGRSAVRDAPSVRQNGKNDIATSSRLRTRLAEAIRSY